MGIHYVNGALLGETQLHAAKPQALIYGPANGKLRLVGVEFIVDAATWLAGNGDNPPVLDGQVFQFVDAPNRFNIPHSSSCTSGPGGTIPRVRSWTGTIT